mgnify:CR=1 FL=1
MRVISFDDNGIPKVELKREDEISKEDIELENTANYEKLDEEIKKTNEEILEEKVDDYYKVFISQDEKSILTFLLYALYYLRKRKQQMNH